MDANKIKKLSEIDYTIKNCCGLCKYSHISLDGWGICNLHKYKHQKHVGEERQLSVHQFGYCDKFELDENKTSDLHHYSSLIKRECPILAAIDWSEPIPPMPLQSCPECHNIHYTALLEAVRQAKLSLLK